MVTCILGSGQTDTNGKYVTKWMSESEFPEKNNDQHENMIIPTVTVGKSQTNVSNVTMHPHSQAIWGHIWKHTLEKNQMNRHKQKICYTMNASEKHWYYV